MMWQKRDPGVKWRGKKETEPSADEEVEALGEVKEADQSTEYIAHFTKVVELYQKKGCEQTSLERVFKHNGGWQRREAEPLRSWLPLSGHLQMRCLEHKDIIEDFLLEPRPTHSLEWA